MAAESGRRRAGSLSRFAVVSFLLGVSAFAVHLAAAHASTTTASSANFVYDVSTVALVDAHEITAGQLRPALLSDVRLASDPHSVVLQGASTTPNPGSNATEAASPGLSGVNRVGSALKTDAQHAFPDVVDNFATEGSKFSIPTKGPGGVVVRNSDLFQVEGSLNGKSGVFEWIVDQGEMTHRRFISGGKVTGYPNQVPTP